MDPLGIRAFMARDWDRVADAKAAYWEDRKRLLGAGEGLRVSDELRREVKATRPEWPSDADRRDDRQAHVELSRRLKDASAILFR